MQMHDEISMFHEYLENQMENEHVIGGFGGFGEKLHLVVSGKRII